MLLKKLFRSGDSPSSARNKGSPVNLALFFRKNRGLMLAILFGAVFLLLLLGGKDESAPEPMGTGNLTEYTRLLREELEDVLSRMEGVGRCTVLITFSDAGETVYAMDSDRTESDGKLSEKNEYVLISSRSSGLVLSVRSPSVVGVAVICDGGDRSSVKTDVTEVLSDTLGIPPGRIAVKKRMQ